MSLRNRPPQKPARSARSIVAAAENLADKMATTTGTQIGEAWQRDALTMYDLVPEFRAAARLVGQALSQVRLTIAKIDPEGEPIPLDVGTPEEPGADADNPAAALLAAFAGGPGGQSAMLDAIGGFLTVTGEAVVVGNIALDADPADDFTKMVALSPEQVRATGGGSISVRRDQTTTLDRVIDKEAGEVAIRIWRPHLRYSWQADAPGRSALVPLREIRLYDQHIEASAVSRLIGAGLLGVPEGLTLPGLEAAEDGSDADLDPFMRFLMHVMSLAIKDRESAAARVPILVRGEAEDLQALTHITFSTPFDEKVQELRDAAIDRLAVAVDLPSDLLRGLGSTQSWTGSLITQDWVNNYLPALMALICGSLTTGWLHPALVYNGAEDTSVETIVWFDASAVRTRENTEANAFQAYSLGLISDESMRRILGLDEGDAVDEPEQAAHLMKLMALKNPGLAPLLLAALGYVMTPEVETAAKAINAITGSAPAAQAGAAPGSGSPADATPTSQPGTAANANQPAPKAPAARIRSVK